MRVIVVGGGISGISTAYLIKKKTAYDVLLIEKSHIAGKARSIRKNGYLIETGPNGFLENKQETLRLIHESHFENNLIESNDEARKRFIFSKNSLHPVSANPKELITETLLSKKAILRIAKEPFVKPKAEDETVSEFVSRRLGKEFLNKIIGPMVCGVFAGDPAIMSMWSNFRRIKEIENQHGSLIKGLISLMRQKKATASSTSGGFDAKLLSFKDGIESFFVHLSKNIPKEKDRIISVEKHNGKYLLYGEKNRYTAETVVFAAEAFSLATIIKNIDPELSQLLKGIPYAPMAVVALGFRRKLLPEIVNSFGYLFALDEIRDITGVLFDSSIFPFRSDKEHFLIRLMVGGALAKNGPFKSDLFKISAEELQRSAKIFSPFEFAFKVIHPRAIPIYTMKHQKVMEAIEDFMSQNKGLFICGNAFYGISLNDCIKHAYYIAEKIKAG